MKESVQVDAVIVGGGVIGLCVGLAYKQRFPQSSLALLEKNPYLGDETTGRNSGVLHAGIYYPQNSLKSKFCLEGRPLWEDYLTKKSINWLKCGKFIVAKSAEESQFLGQLKKNAEDCGAQGLRLASPRELTSLTQHVHVDDALFSSLTGVMDVGTALQALRLDFEASGGIVLTQRPVLQLESLKQGHYQFETPYERICAAELFNCAGLGGVQLRRCLGLHELTDFWVKGHYLSTTQRLDYHHHYYPLPLKNLHGLGVHATIDPHGKVKFGPDTESVELIDYHLSPERLTPMVEATRTLFKNIDESKLYLDYAGIRPKIKLRGELYQDFWVKGPRELGLEGYYECCGIESPGLTSSFAIARYLVEMI